MAENVNHRQEMIEMFRKLKLRLSNARAEEKKAKLRVQRLEVQVDSVARQLGGFAVDLSKQNNDRPTHDASPDGGTATPATSAPDSNSIFSAITTSVMDTLPTGWFSAIDGASGKTYYYNNKTGAVQWTSPNGGSFDEKPNSILEVRKPGHEVLIAHSDASGPNSGKTDSTLTHHSSVYDRLTDHRFYTGAHKHRFDQDGNGKFVRSPPKMSQRGAHFQVSSTYKGHTNTGTNESFDCISEFVVRTQGNAGRWNTSHKGDAWELNKQMNVVL